MLLRVLTLPPPGHIYHRAKIRPSLGIATVAADVTPTTIGDLIHRGGRQTANPVGNVALQPPDLLGHVTVMADQIGHPMSF